MNSNDFSDVIVAPASGAGRCAVAVVRLSGKGCATLCGMLRVVRPGDSSNALKMDRRMRLVWLAEPVTGRLLDQAMVVAYEAGSSFTGEESVEIFCHGGPVIVDSIIRACVALGARLAGPGEFTRRAVAAGRLDLVQAEAVSLLTESENQASASAGLDALGGRPSETISRMSGQLLDVLAEIEASLDFDQEDDVYVDLSGVPSSLERCVADMDRWLADSVVARPALSGFRIVLAGRANAGKSTLFNALAGADRAIVHDRPGTTRDVISEQMVLAGNGCVLFDTAGLRSADDPVESEGVRRALETAAAADLVLHVLDGLIISQAGKDDQAACSRSELERAGVRSIVTVITKADRQAVDPGFVASIPGKVFCVSAKTGAGIDGLKSFLSETVDAAIRSASSVRVVVNGERQVTALRLARSNVEKALGAMSDEAPPEVVAAFVRASVQALGEITGSHITEQVLDRIFSRFCIGK